MGVFLEPDDAKHLSQVEGLKLLDSDVLDERFIVPAERILEQVFRLGLNTDSEPWSWSGTFDERSDLRDKYWADCKTAVLLITEAMVLNPHGFASQSSAGISVSYGALVPAPAHAIMAQWGKTGRVFRA